MIRAVLGEYARAHGRVFEDRANTVGASDIGRCGRQVFYVKNETDADFGAPRNPDFTESWGATMRGRIFEDHFWVPALRARYGERLRFAGAQQETFALGFLSATPDALLVALGGDALAPLGVPDIGGDGSLALECKTVDPRSKLAGPRLEHIYQAQVQLGLLHELTSHRPEYSLISYVDASLWDLIYEFPIRRDPTIFEEAQRRSARILTATAAEQLAPEGWIAGGRECELCPYSRACGGERARIPQQATEDPDPQFIGEIADLARQAKRHEAELQAAAAEFRGLQHEIKERLRARGFRRIVGDGVAVTWSAVKGRPSYNMAAMREAAIKAGIDINQFETTGEASDRLIIQATEQSGGLT
jgi:hypothetical protein